MALIKAFAGALGGTFADQWLDIITVGQFDEHVALMPGVYQETNQGRGSNTKHSDAVISNGSRIYVPENTAAFIFDQSGIESIITESGSNEYRATNTVSPGCRAKRTQSRSRLARTPQPRVHGSHDSASVWRASASKASSSLRNRANSLSSTRRTA